uniref:EGF-like domain-containing protein n=1 Tax=Eutreptiella gymnastica TaxID=73025 RepID=A0A7S1IIS4_9EUGL
MAVKVHRLRFIIVGTYIITAVLGFVLVVRGNLEAGAKDTNLLSSSSTFSSYRMLTDMHFPVEGERSCDYCAAYFQPSERFPEGCKTFWQNWDMFKQPDGCGVCGGTNECFGCNGQTSTYTALYYDACGACTQSGPMTAVECNSCPGRPSQTGSLLLLNACNECVSDNVYGQGRCDTASQCSMHGSYGTDSAQCVCQHIFTGYDCSQCRCQKGGTCNAQRNTCECPIIAAKDVARPDMYNASLHCSNAGEICNCSGVVMFGASSAGWMSREIDGPIECLASRFGPHTDVYNNNAFECRCVRDHTIYEGRLCEQCKCRGRGYCVGNKCKCKGSWGGALCTECRCPAGSWCNLEGQCQSCVLDSCGVCFGNNTCLEPAKKHLASILSVARERFEVDMWFGLSQNLEGPDPQFSPQQPAVQMFGYQVCKEMLAKPEIEWQSVCIFQQWKVWLENQDLAWPYAHEDFAQKFWEFVSAEGLWDYAAFDASSSSSTVINKNSYGLKVIWLRVTYGTYVDLEALPGSVMNIFELWQNLIKHATMQATKMAPGLLPITQSSVFWVDAANQLVCRHSTIVAVILSMIITTVATLAFSSSPLLTIVTAVSNLVCLLLVLSLMTIFKMTIGAVEFVGLIGLMGLMANLNMHMVEGYMEFIHGHRSHLLKAKLTRANCIQGMLLRTGVPVTSAAIAVCLCSGILLLFTTKIMVRTGQMILLAQTVSLAVTLIFSPALLAIIGPTKIIRTRKSLLIYSSSVIVLSVILVLLIWGTKLPIRWPNGALIFQKIDSML